MTKKTIQRIEDYRIHSLLLNDILFFLKETNLSYSDIRGAYRKDLVKLCMQTIGTSRFRAYDIVNFLYKLVFKAYEPTY